MSVAIARELSKSCELGPVFTSFNRLWPNGDHLNAFDVQRGTGQTSWSSDNALVFFKKEDKPVEISYYSLSSIYQFPISIWTMHIRLLMKWNIDMSHVSICFVVSVWCYTSVFNTIYRTGCIWNKVADDKDIMKLVKMGFFTKPTPPCSLSSLPSTDLSLTSRSQLLVELFQLYVCCSLASLHCQRCRSARK